MNDIDLGSMLADAEASGAYYVDAEGHDTLADAARALDFAFVPIDLHDCTDKEQALARIAKALEFPGWFGGNWDALADCLNDLSWRPAQGYVLVIDHTQQWRQAEPDAFDTLLDIANEAAATWAELAVPFWLLVPVAPGEVDFDTAG